VDPREQLSLLGERDVDERVQRHDGVERRGREADFAHVGMEEPCSGHERASPLDLHGREVHAGDRAPVRNQPPRDRDTAPTAEVEHVGMRGKALGELGEPITVFVVVRVETGSIGERHRVVARLDDTLRVRRLRATVSPADPGPSA
jgi:hypothetical protein